MDRRALASQRGGGSSSRSSSPVRPVAARVPPGSFSSKSDALGRCTGGYRFHPRCGTRRSVAAFADTVWPTVY
jgi:hypothetical protein